MRMRILGVLASWIVHRVHSFLVTKIDHQGLCGIVVVVSHFLQTHTDGATHRRRSSAQLSSMTQKHLGSQIALIWSGLRRVVVVACVAVAGAALIAAKRSNNSMSKCQSKPFDIFITHSTGWPNSPHANWPWHAEDIFECVRCAAWCITHTNTHALALLRKTQATNLRRRQRALFALQVATRHDTRWSQDRQVLIAIQFSVTSWRKANKAIKCLYT